jgi:hypothetical protein
MSISISIHSSDRQPQSVVPVTIDVVKQLTVYYQAWKENRISEEQLQQLNNMPIDANTGLVWWQVRRCPPRATPSPHLAACRVALFAAPHSAPRHRSRRAAPAPAPRLASFVWHGGSPRPLPLAAAARFLTRVLFLGSALGRGAGGGGTRGGAR